MDGKELIKEIYQAYNELIDRTNELLDLLETYLAPELYDHIRQQNAVWLRVTKETIEEAQRNPEYLSIYVQNL